MGLCMTCTLTSAEVKVEPSSLWVAVHVYLNGEERGGGGDGFNS